MLSPVGKNSITQIAVDVDFGTYKGSVRYLERDCINNGRLGRPYGELTGDSETVQHEPFPVGETLLQHAVDSVRLVLVPLHHRRVQVLDGVEVDEPVGLTLAGAEAGDLRGS
jgi:hypothetical protein